MVFVVKRLPILMIVLVVLALSCSLLSVSCDGFTDTAYLNTPTPTPLPTATPLPPVSPGAVTTPNAPNHFGFCGNLSPVASPFGGWPTTDTSKHGDIWITPGGLFCDPDYGFGTHEGIDFLYYLGTPVRATGEALAVEAGWNDVMGNYVRLCSGIVSGWCVRYMHLSSIAIPQWDTATDGQVIGYVGGTGTGAGGDLSGSNGRVHLHYDMTFNNDFYDPYPTLSR